MNENKQIGIGLCIIGIICMTIGVMMFFERKLLAMGDLAFLAGLGVLLGPQGLYRFFSPQKKLKGTVCFFGGFLIIVWGYSFIGFVIQMIGAWFLFAAYLANVIQWLRMVPGVDVVLNLPGIKQLVSAMSGNSTQLPY